MTRSTSPNSRLQKGCFTATTRESSSDASDGDGLEVGALPELTPFDGAGGAPDEPDGCEPNDEEGGGTGAGAGGDGGAAGRTGVRVSTAFAKGKKLWNSERTLRL